MGWTSFSTDYCEFNKRGQVDKRATMSREIESYGDCEVVKSAMAGGNYYAVVHNVRRDCYYLIVCLTEVKDGEFYYKDMDDTMGPCEKQCPKSILDLADKLCPCTDEYDPHGYAKAWRDECRKRLADKDSPTAFRNVGYDERIEWHVPEDSTLMMGGDSIAGMTLTLTKVRGRRSWIHKGLHWTRVPTRFVNPNDCKKLAA